MIVTLPETDGYIKVEREKGDPKYATESTLLYHIKNHLNKKGFNLIKKRMWKDGHLVDDTQQYLRSRKPDEKDSIYIHSTHYAIRDISEEWNKYGEVTTLYKQSAVK